MDEQIYTQMLDENVESILRRMRMAYANEFNIWRTSNYREVNDLVKYLSDEINLTEKIHIKHIKMAVLNMIYCFYYYDNEFLKYSRGRNTHYNKSLNRYNPLSIKYKLIEVIDTLIKHKYLEGFPGYLPRHGGQSYRSRITYTDKFIDLTYRFNVKPHMVNDTVGHEVVILKDHEKSLTGYIDNANTYGLRKFLKKYNEFLSKCELALDKKGINLAKKHIDLKAKTVHRSFNEKFTLGGRFYGGFWMVMSKNLRKYILINDYPTVELDFKGLHINLLYDKVGEYFEGDDVYALPTGKYNQTKKFRTLVKKITQILLNAKNDRRAIRSFEQEILLKKNKRRKYPNPLPDCYEVLDDIKKYHASILLYFNSEIGRELQYIDSLIAEYVIRKMLKLRLPVLSIHDSFITCLKDRDTLHQIMLDGYRNVVGRKFKPFQINLPEIKQKYP